MPTRRSLLALLAVLPAAPALAQRLTPALPDTAEAERLVARLRQGGLTLYFRHADTTGMPCDRTYRIGERDGQRNISQQGREQSRQIGAALRDLGIPLELPVLAGPVFRARDTAELAFGVQNVRVTERLLADDYAGARLSWVIDEHRRLFVEPVPAGRNRVLVGHRTPAIMVLGEPVAGRAFPEGAAIVLDPGGAAPRAIGVLHLAPLPGRGFHQC